MLPVILDRQVAGRGRATAAAVAETADGSLLMHIRTQLGRIYRSRSKDKGETWSPTEMVRLLSPEAPSALARVPELAAVLEFVLGDARALPFAAGSFDAACMAFGIRNVPERPRALLEIRRVLRPGSRLAVLELSDPRGGLLAPLARLHVHRVVPWIGAALGGGAEYRYLARSIAAFPAAAGFAEELGAAGFLVTAVTALGFGAVHLYVGVAGDRS